MPALANLRIKLFMDGADLSHIEANARQPHIKGFTTNPTLMRQAGVTDYAAFAQQALKAAGDLPISFEVFSDDFATMEKEARAIASWGSTIYVKIPVTTTKGESCVPLIQKLSAEGFSLNVTALMTEKQVADVAVVLNVQAKTIISVFAGRIADTGRDPMPVMRACKQLLRNNPNAELLWASQRELLNIFHAQESGCDIITVTPDTLRKLSLLGRDLEEYSLDTVKMFYKDATDAGFAIV